MSNDRTLGLAAIGLALILVIFGWGLAAPFAYEPVGPRVFPMITAALIGATGLILAIRGGTAAPLPRAMWRGAIVLSVTLLAYAVTFDWLGFVPSTAIMAFVVARIFGATVAQAAISALLLSVGTFLVFDHGLDVVLPTGLLGDLL